MSIKILDQNTVNKIAAGEVIENPSNVVKELVENAIDSGAKNIVVEITDGGSSLIKVTDDGSGFEKEDIKLAFMTHATSKLSKLEDIYNIDSYGFRGEALPSIASISKITLITKKNSNEAVAGYKYVIEAGIGNNIEEVAANVGTSIIVEDLFSNVPVRKKFLKSFAKENALVSDTIIKFALVRPDISFKCLIDYKLKFKSNGDGILKNVIYDIYGRDIYNRLIEINETIKNVHIFGYIARPEVARNNRNDELYFVNNRFVKNKIITKAIEEAYESYLMQHKFPFVVIMIDCDKSNVDVNVHPKKEEVRFDDDELIYYAVFNIIYNKLKNTELIHIEKLVDDCDLENKSNNISDDTFDSKANNINELNLASLSNFENKNSYNNKCEINDKITCDDRNDSFNKSQNNYDGIIDNKCDDIKNKNDSPYEFPNDRPIDIDELPTMANETNALSFINMKSNTGFSLNKVIEKFEEKPFITKTLTEDHKYIGQVFNTYILVEFDNKLYIIDQHAAHEKINFENLMERYKKNEIMSQRIFPSIILRLTPLQYEAVTKNIDEFTKIGYELEFFGDKDIKVDAVPYNLLDISSEKLLIEMIDSFIDTKNKEQYESIVEKIASMSCKKAIKANHSLTESEVKNLLRELFKLDNPYNCPHGRPTIISLSKTEFEKRFGRIV